MILHQETQNAGDSFERHASQIPGNIPASWPGRYIPPPPLPPPQDRETDKDDEPIQNPPPQPLH